MDMRELPWPEPGDKLFTSEEPDFLNNCFLGANRSIYEDGYKLAADALVDKLMEKRTRQDFLVYPIVFLYRHYIELSLKHMIFLGNKISKDEFRLPEHHRIDALWSEARKILEEMNSGSPKKVLDAVESCLKELARRDPTGEAFRYPMDLKRRHYFEKQEQVNLRHFRETMEKISSLFEGAVGYLLNALDCKREMERDAGM